MEMIAAAAAAATDNTGVLVAVIMAVASIVGTAVGGYFVYRLGKRNSEATKAIEQDKLSTSTWDAQVKGWREDVITLRQQRAEDAAEHAAKLEACQEQLRQTNARLEEVVRMHEQDRNEHMERRRQQEQRIDAMVYWGREVVGIMQQHGIEFPAPPVEISVLGRGGE